MEGNIDPGALGESVKVGGKEKLLMISGRKGSRAGPDRDFYANPSLKNAVQQERTEKKNQKEPRSRSSNRRGKELKNKLY